MAKLIWIMKLVVINEKHQFSYIVFGYFSHFLIRGQCDYTICTERKSKTLFVYTQFHTMEDP